MTLGSDELNPNFKIQVGDPPTTPSGRDRHAGASRKGNIVFMVSFGPAYNKFFLICLPTAGSGSELER